MTPPTMQKKEILTTRETPYLRLVPIERTPEQLLDLELREGVVAIATPAGTERPRRLYKIAAGELYPLRVAARVIRDMLEAEIDPHAVYAAFAQPLKRYIDRLFKRRPAQLPPTPTYRALPRA